VACVYACVYVCDDGVGFVMLLDVQQMMDVTVGRKWPIFHPSSTDMGCFVGCLICFLVHCTSMLICTE